MGRCALNGIRFALLTSVENVFVKVSKSNFVFFCKKEHFNRFQ